jgi:hypothetical protein
MVRKITQVPTPETRAEQEAFVTLQALAELSTAMLLDAIQRPHISIVQQRKHLPPGSSE